MLNGMSRRDATQEKKRLDIHWLLRQDPRVIEAVDNTTNPTRAKEKAFQIGLSTRNARNALRFGIFKRNHTKDGVYEKLMEEYRAHQGGAK